MGFSADLKDFVKSFEGGMKAATPTVADARLAELQDQRQYLADLKARQDAAGGSAVTGGGGAGVPIYEGRSPTGRLPTFAQGEGALPALEKAIAKTESDGSGGYSAVGPVTKTGDRAYGYTQIMGNNIPSWTKEALGVELSPEQFLSDPKAQQATTRYHLNKMLQQYGNPDDVASVWFSGKPASAAGGRSDVTGTTVPEYIRRVRKNLPGRAALNLEDQPTAFAATGGLIPDTHYSGFDDDAGSNPVTRDIRERGVDIDQTGSVPEQTDQPAPSAPVDQSRISEAMGAGLKYIQSKLGLDGSAIADVSPRTQDAARALAHNVGAADHDQIEAANRAVDPTGEMPAAQRNAMRLVGMYDFMHERGDEQGAARASAAMLMHSKEIARRAGMMTLAALDKGDLEGASRALQSAYDYFPDGRSLLAKATPAGVQYELVDQTGKGLAEGGMSKDEVKQLATDMINGKQWFQMVQAAVEPPNPAAQRAEADRAAMERFQGTLSPEQLDEYRQTLEPDQLKEFNKLPTSLQQKAIDTARRERAEEAKAFRFDERLARAQETGDRREAIDLFKFAVRQNNWATVREQVLNENELRRAQKELEEAGRGTRQQLSFAQRDKLQQKIDERILNARPKMTAKEREAAAADQALNQQTSARKEAIAADIPEGEVGPTQGQQQRMSAVDAGAAFSRSARAPNAQFDDSDYAAIGERLTKSLPKNFGEADQLWARRIASDIRRSGNLSNDDAAMLTQRALSQPTEPRVMPDGSVVIDPRLPAVKMSEDSLLSLARMRARMQPATPQGNGGALPGVSEPATPGAGPAPTGRGALFISPAQAREQARTEQRIGTARSRMSALALEQERDTAPGGASYEQLKSQLGSDWTGPTMSYGQMRQALQDREDEQKRLERGNPMQRYREGVRRGLDLRYPVQ